MPLQQIMFKNIVAKGELAHNEQLLHLPQCFLIYLMIIISHKKVSHSAAQVFSKLPDAKIIACCKG